jgi:hypothetical protein
VRIVAGQSDFDPYTPLTSGYSVRSDH